MSKAIIEVSNLSKRYRLGNLGASSLREEAQLLWKRLWRKNGAQTQIRDKVTVGLGSDGRLTSSEHNPRSSGNTSDFWALNGVSFSIQAGEVVGIIGRNGAGKSTLLKILSRVTEPTGGEAIVRGRVASLLEVGTGFHPDLTGRENVFFNGAILGMKKAEIRAKFDEIVEFAEIAQFIDTPVKRYSSGMYVRLAFAVAVHLEPEILVLDEVLSVGDAGFQKRCMDKMEEVRNAGGTILLVSHSMASINNLCDRAILLNAGKVEVDGKTEEVTRRYISGHNTGRGEVVWLDRKEAPGNEVVRLQAVRILQDDSAEAAESVDISKEISIQIQYWNLSEGARLYTAISLRDKWGGFVLS